MITENDALMEIVHLASAALVADLTDVKRQALADIYDAVASLLPVERAGVGGEGAAETQGTAETQGGRDGCPQPSADPQGFAKFMTVAPGVQLVRFHGNEDIILQARRKGSAGNPNTIFSIDVSKQLKKATVMRDRKVLFEIHGHGVGYNRVEAMAVSALRRWFKSQRKRSSKRRRAAKAKRKEEND